LMIKLFRQSKTFKTRVLSIVFWLLSRFRRSCRTWLRRWIQCSFEDNVDVLSYRASMYCSTLVLLRELTP
jgi:hypothetical protein